MLTAGSSGWAQWWEWKLRRLRKSVWEVRGNGLEMVLRWRIRGDEWGVADVLGKTFRKWQWIDHLPFYDAC